MRDTGEWYGAYAERVAAITAAYNAALVARAGADLVPLLVAHSWWAACASTSARGERELHIGDAYTATPQAIPPGPQYVALGHIHAPQAVPGAPVPAEYAGSLLAARLRRGRRDQAGRDRRRRAGPARDGRGRSRSRRPTARPRDGDVGRARRSGGRARATRTSTSPVRVGGTDPDARPPGRRDLPLPGQRPGRRDRRTAAAGVCREAGVGRTTRSSTPSSSDASTTATPPPELLALLREVLEERRCVRVS